MSELAEAFMQLQHTMLSLSKRDQRRFWDVLSALRGPDDDNKLLKHATTAVIRKKVLPMLEGEVPADFRSDEDAYAGVRTKLDEDGAGGHFITHARWAFNALGLRWYEVNK